MSAKTYILHSIKYFFKLIALIIIIYLLLFVTKTARVSAEYFVSELWTSPKGLTMLAVIAALAAFYPKFGFVKRSIGANITEDREGILAAFHASNYALTDEVPGESMTFRAAALTKKLMTAFDDKVTITATEEGIVIDGSRKEVAHAEFRINTYLHSRENEE